MAGSGSASATRWRGRASHVAVVYAQSRDQAEGVARELTSQISGQRRRLRLRRHRRRGGDARWSTRCTERFGRLDILVNDAAYNKSIPFTDLDGLTMEVWDKIIAVNLTGPMRLIKAVAPVMKAQGSGRIVNIASVSRGSGRPARRSPMRCRRPG